MILPNALHIPTLTLTRTYAPTGTHRSPRTRTPSPSSASLPSATPLPQARPAPVALHTPGGLTLAAALYTPQGDGPFPGVILSHTGGANRDAWGRVPQLLQSAGYAVLSYDFRGHGHSEGQLDPSSAASDLRTALAYLRSQPQVDVRRIALVGASMGGQASVIVGAVEPDVRTVVAISASPDAAGQYPGRVIGQLSPRQCHPQDRSHA